MTRICLCFGLFMSMKVLVKSSSNQRSGPEQKKSPGCWNIKYVQIALGRAVCNNMLFAHAILGCDTTSRVFSMGKGLALKHIRSDKHFITQAEVFLQEMYQAQEKQHYYACTQVQCVRPVHVLCSRKTFLRHHRLLSPIASVCTFRCKYGWENQG